MSKMRKWFGSKTKQNEPGAQIASEKSGHPSKVSSPTWNAASPNQPQQQQAAVRQQPAQSARTSFSSPDASEEDTQTSIRSASTGTAGTLASGKVERRHSVDSKRSARNSAPRETAIVWDGRVTWFAVGLA